MLKFPNKKSTGKFPATLEDIDYDLESEGGEGERKTRSGKSYFTDDRVEKGETHFEEKYA